MARRAFPCGDGAALNRVEDPERKTLIYVNNRLEGNALETVSAMVEEAEVRR